MKIILHHKNCLRFPELYVFKNNKCINHVKHLSFKNKDLVQEILSISNSPEYIILCVPRTMGRLKIPLLLHQTNKTFQYFLTLPFGRIRQIGYLNKTEYQFELCSIKTAKSEIEEIKILLHSI